MQLGERLTAFKATIARDFEVSKGDAEDIAVHVEQIVKDELAQSEVMLNAFEGNIQLHPFVYGCLAAITASAVTIALVFVAKF